MATTLTKNLIRESTDKVGDKEIQITLTFDQLVELKLKGSRGKGFSIPINKLYEQLSGTTIKGIKGEGSVSVVRDKLKAYDRKMISLFDLRSHNAISTLDIITLAKFDQLIKSVLDSYKK